MVMEYYDVAARIKQSNARRKPANRKDKAGRVGSSELIIEKEEEEEERHP
jgi:hypothetical protein